MNQNPECMTIDALCKTLSIGKNTAYSLLKSGSIEAFKIGSKWIIPKESVSKYISDCINKPKPIEPIKIV